MKQSQEDNEKTLSKGILGVNIMTVITNYSDMVRTSIEEGMDFIIAGAGVPLDLPKYLGEGWKQNLYPNYLQASDEDIRIIKGPVGLPGRTIFNQFLQESREGKRKPSVCRYHCIRTCNPKTTEYCITQALQEDYSLWIEATAAELRGTEFMNSAANTQAGFSQVFAGIKIPDDISLAECKKTQKYNKGKVQSNANDR